jgi:hypothetical protein
MCLGRAAGLDLTLLVALITLTRRFEQCLEKCGAEYELVKKPDDKDEFKRISPMLQVGKRTEYGAGYGETDV